MIQDTIQEVFQSSQETEGLVIGTDEINSNYKYTALDAARKMPTVGSLSVKSTLISD